MALTRKELKGHDLAEYLNRARFWFDENRDRIVWFGLPLKTFILYVAGGVVAIAILAGGYTLWYKPKQDEKRRSEFESIFFALVNQEGAEHPDPEAFRGVANQAAAFSKTWSGTPAAAHALIVRGNALMASGEFDAAIEAYRGVVRSYPKEFFAPFAQYRIGIVMEEKNDFDGALTAYQELQKRWPGHFLVPQAKISEGMVHELKGEMDAARVAYEAVEDGFPESPWSRKAEERLVRLRGGATITK